MANKEEQEEQTQEQTEETGLDELGNEESEDEDGKSDNLPFKKILLFVVVPLILLCGIGAGLYFTGLLDSFIGTSDKEHIEGEGENKSKDDGHGKKSKNKDDDYGGGGGDAAFLAIPTMIVNLKTSDGTPRYLRLTVQLELENDADRASIEALLPRVIDQFQTYLRELRVKDLRGSAGIYRLQMELLWRVNQAAAPIEVKDVLFQEILIQ